MIAYVTAINSEQTIQFAALKLMGINPWVMQLGPYWDFKPLWMIEAVANVSNVTVQALGFAGIQFAHEEALFSCFGSGVRAHKAICIKPVRLKAPVVCPMVNVLQVRSPDIAYAT